MIQKSFRKSNVNIAYCMRMIRYYDDEQRLAAKCYDINLEQQALGHKHHFVALRNQFLSWENKI